MNTLFLAWQAPQSRRWYPVGRLDADDRRQHFDFGYTHGAQDAKKDGFGLLSAFPELDRRYRSNHLFELFENRLMRPSRADYPLFLESLGLENTPHDPLQILALTGGLRKTDHYELFPQIELRSDHSFVCQFFLHGVRHCAQSVLPTLDQLKAGQPLRIALELNNPATGYALQLQTEDYEMIGWAPRYLVNDLIQAIANDSKVAEANLIRANPLGTPLNRRFLVELSGYFPESHQPMSSEQFQPIVPLTQATC